MGNILTGTEADDLLNQPVTQLKKLAKNRRSSAKTLEVLSNSENKEVRRYVAGNKKTNLETLRKLSTDEDYLVKRTLAKNLVAVEKLSHILIETDDDHILRSIASNPVTPTETLTILCDRHIQSFEDLNCGNVILASSVLSHLASNPSSPDNVLHKLFCLNIMKVKINLAANKKTPPQILRQLAEEKDERIIIMIADNTATPPDILHRFATHHNITVRTLIARNTNTAPETYRALADDIYSVKFNLVANNQVPSETLEYIAYQEFPKKKNQKSDWVLENLTFNVNSPEWIETMYQLTK